MSDLSRAVQFIRAHTSTKFQVCMITGSGLGDLAHIMDLEFSLHYHQIPHFPTSTVKGHQGVLLGGKVNGKAVLLFQGRFHLYEGHTAQSIALPIRAARALGCEYLFITSATGGLAPSFVPGDLMLVKDHINLTGTNPLLGHNDDTIGPRFPDLTKAYPAYLRDLAKEIGTEVGIPFKEGVYVAVLGPSLETPSETRFLRMIGADAVGMSTVPEVIAGVHCGMKVLVVAVICNVNNPDDMAEIRFEDVLDVAKRVSPVLSRFWFELIGRL